MDKNLVKKVAEVKHITGTQSDLELFSKVTGLIHATEDMMNGDDANWYVPAGAFIPSDSEMVAAHVGEEVTEDNKQYDLDNDNDIDLDDVAIAKDKEQQSEIEIIEEAEYEYIHNEETWNASFANGALKDYYVNNPDEDRWNIAENRAANFNDKVYDVTIDGIEKQFAAHWETDNVQSIKNLADAEEVYYLDMFYSIDANAHELFTDIELSESTGKMATFTAINWNDETCPHCWEGAINAPGAVLPFAWIAVKTPEGFDGIVRLTYDETTTNLAKNETIISATQLFGPDFDESKFKAFLVRK